MKRMKRLRIASSVIIAVMAVGLLLQCGAPEDLLGKVEDRVSEAQTGELAPEAPSKLAGKAISASQIDLTWSDNSDNEEEFQIQRDSGSGFQGIDTVGADSTAYSDQGLSADTSYTYRVRAANSAGESAWTEEVSATTNPPPTTTPEAPSDLTATAQNADQIYLSWSDNSDNEEVFELIRKKGSEGSYITVDNNIPAETLEYQDTGLDSETGYYYRVRAVNSAGESNWSNEANDISDQLAAPSGLTATAVSDTQIDLSWTDNSVYEEHFEIGRDESTIDSSVSANSESYSDSGLDSHTNYTYRVRATDNGGESAWSTEASATTDYAIGDTGPAGGLIFYDDEADGVDNIADARYLEAAPASTEWTSKEWGADGTQIGGDAELTGIGDGQAATDAIVQHLNNNTSETGKAAQLCDNLTEGGYSDWFLPSQNELNQMYVNLHNIGTPVGGFASDYYWSSSEDNANDAWFQDFSDAGQYSNAKHFDFRVRAVRAF